MSNICKYCNKEFKSERSLSGHLGRCSKRREELNLPKLDCNLNKESNKHSSEHRDWKCKYCNSIYNTRATLREHIKNFHIVIKSTSNYVINATCKFCNRKLRTSSTLIQHERYCNLNPDKIEYIGHPCSLTHRKKISETSKKNKKSGGYRPHKNGKWKSGWYNGIYFDSSWELAYYLYCKDNNINIIRNKEYFEYTYKGNTHKYLPDFVIDGIYYEIKGIESDKDLEKYKSIPNLIILRWNDIKPIMEIVKLKYGENFISLYE